MSTQQQAMIMETVAAIRKALKRKAYESDSDESIDHTTNRGNKLKKKARFVSQGRIGPSLDFAAYKEVAELAGHHRTIIHSNPPLIDDDGYDLDSDDNEERVQEALASANDSNPYASIHLERLLAPLTSVTDLPTHPTLSQPFTSKALTQLVNQARDLSQKENAALWKVKPLLTKLVGDNTWAPCGMMIEENDHQLFTETARFLLRPTDTSPREQFALPNPTGRILGESSVRETAEPNHIENGRLHQDQSKGKAAEQADEEPIADDDGTAERRNPTSPGKAPNKEADHVNGDKAPVQDENGRNVYDANGSKETIPKSGDVEMTEAPPDDGTTDGRRQEKKKSASEKGNGRADSPGNLSGGMPASLELLEELFIHPLFQAPRAAHPDRDIGLPEQEADDVRRILQLYVQKQEEVCRGTTKLYEGLMKADRLRKTVMQWAKAEAHCGSNRDMSDGEDWYDKEEWGITEDLKKGEDEVEEDTAQTQKKTRNRK